MRRGGAACAVAALLAVLLGSGCRMEHDPATMVTVEVTGIADDAARDEVVEILKGMTDGNSHLLTSTWDGQTMAVQLSPVADVSSFSRRINFGKVTEVNGRTVKVDYVRSP